jgi:hypothetical protein
MSYLGCLEHLLGGTLFKEGDPETSKERMETLKKITANCIPHENLSNPLEQLIVILNNYGIREYGGLGVLQAFGSGSVSLSSKRNRRVKE